MAEFATKTDHETIHIKNGDKHWNRHPNLWTVISTGISMGLFFGFHQKSYWCLAGNFREDPFHHYQSSSQQPQFPSIPYVKRTHQKTCKFWMVKYHHFGWLLDGYWMVKSY